MKCNHGRQSVRHRSVWELIDEIPVAMVVTHEGRAEHAVPADGDAPAKGEGAIYFLTDADAPKAAEIRRNQSICLALADNRSQKYVSISGHAEIIDDRDRIKKFWSIYDKAFWPDKNDPRIRSSASRQRAPSSGRVRKVVTAVELVAAIASGERMDLGSNEKVGFASGRQTRPVEARIRGERPSLRVEPALS